MGLHDPVQLIRLPPGDQTFDEGEMAPGKCLRENSLRHCQITAYAAFLPVVR